MNEIFEQVHKKNDKSVAAKRIADFMNGFSEFAVKASGIVGTLLPQSPEYTITFVSTSLNTGPMVYSKLTRCQGLIVLIFKVCTLDHNTNVLSPRSASSLSAC